MVGLSRHDRTAEPWAVIAPVIPQQPPGPGRKRNAERGTLNGLLVVLQTGGPGEALPRVYGSPATCWRRFTAWAWEGPWEQRWRAVLSHLEARGKLEWAQAVLDGRVVPAQQGGPGSAPRKGAPGRP